MPTVILQRTLFYHLLGKHLTDEEFRTLCFDYGIELDDITTEKEMNLRESGQDKDASEEIVYKIDIPANRYDLLCMEGLTRSLRIFLGLEKMKSIGVSKLDQSGKVKLYVESETKSVRPYVVSAVLRNIHFDAHSYNSFLDLQDKLHQNICRKRTLVAIGTHDLDNIKAPFYYKAKTPKDIKFVPLMEDKEFHADELMTYYENKANCKLKPYVKIIKDSPVYPVIYDSNDKVLSLPPIINSEYSKISVNTKNVFIECTATDLTKAHVVLNMMTTMFAPYCTPAFTIEPVEVVYSDSTMVTPQLECRTVPVLASYVNSGLGTQIEPSHMVTLLKKMSMECSLDETGKILNVQVPPTRPDVLHPCDIMEDVGIAYGYNNLVVNVPSIGCAAKQLPINKITDLLRENIAQAGFTETLTWALCSTEENFKKLNKEDNNTAVKVSNPKTLEFQLVRTSLLSGLLKTLSANQGLLNLPIKLFEASDVVLLDNKDSVQTDCGAHNERRLAGLYCGASSGLEDIHGLIHRIMELVRIRYVNEEQAMRTKDLQSVTKRNEDSAKYSVVNSKDSTFFPGRCADIYVNSTKVGVFGVIHPEVLDHFEVTNPCSAFELNLDAIMKIQANNL